jgi:hypothetical protein
MKPSWLTVPNARMRLRSYWRSARHPPTSMVMRPTVSTSGRQVGARANAGASRAMRYTPAFTMVAEWRNALTGVGATIAPGSQLENGHCADLVKAPMSTSTSPTSTMVPVGGDAVSAARS